MRRHLLAAAFALWRGDASCAPFGDWAWARQATFIGAVRGEQLRNASAALRRQRKEDRAAHLADLADAVQANRTDGAAALQRLLKQQHKKPYTPAVLPRLQQADGTLCQSHSEITARWRQHFGDMEAGFPCAPETLAGGGGPACWPAPPSILDVPSPGELLQAIARAQPGKAPGPDFIPGELLAAAPAGLLPHVLPLLLKLCLLGEEAVGMQGATLCTLYKQRGARELCGSYRAIMLLPTLVKAMHRSLRPKLYAHVDQCSPPTLLGGRRGASVVFGGHLVRGFCRWQLNAKQSFAVIFADVASTYYRSIRELTARLPDDAHRSNPLAFLTVDHDGLFQRLQEDSVLKQGGASSWLEAITAELHRRTWFLVAGDSQPVQTRRGSRPGSIFADLMFSAGIAEILKLKDSLRAATPELRARPTVPVTSVTRDCQPVMCPWVTLYGLMMLPNVCP